MFLKKPDTTVWSEYNFKDPLPLSLSIRLALNDQYPLQHGQNGP